MRHAGIALVGALADGVHKAEVLAAVGVDDDAGLERRKLLGLPEEEILAVALEGDFDDGRHYSANWPILRYFSSRRRTSLSGLRRLRSSSWRMSASCSALAVSSWL